VRNASSIILKVVAGLLFYLAILLAFVEDRTAHVKLGMLIWTLFFAILALLGGLSLSDFRSWRRDVGMVLLGASGITAFLIFAFACFLMDEEVRRMMRPDSLEFFSDYVTGGGMIVGLTLLGWFFIRAHRRSTEPCGAPEADPALPHPDP
jgi:threonine/homoserine/homoserine lactone efflux protein